MVQPVVGVDDLGGLADDVQVQVRIAVLAPEQAQDVAAAGHAPHDVAVADLEQVRVLLGMSVVLRPHERGLPDLNGVGLARFALSLEVEQLAVVEQAVALAGDGGLHALFDHVVGEQGVVSGFPVKEDVEVILAVGGLEALFELHVLLAALELLVVAGLQVEPVREDDAVSLGQHDAGILDLIDPPGLLDLLAVDDVPVVLLLVRADLQQDEAAHGGVKDFRVVQGLLGLFNRFAVNSGADVGAVLHLDGQVAPHGLHEDAVLDGDVRVRARALHVHVGARPLELVLRREPILVGAAVVHVGQRAVLTHQPFEDLDVPGHLADPEDHEEVRSDDAELGEDRVLVVLEQLAEVRLEALIGNELQVTGREPVVLVFVDGKDVRELHRRAQAQVHVVPEHELRAQGNHVPRHAVVFRGDARGGDEGGVDGAEHPLARLVELVQAQPQLFGVRAQAVADDFVRPARQLLPGPVRFAGFGCVGFGFRRIHGSIPQAEGLPHFSPKSLPAFFRLSPVESATWLSFSITPSVPSSSVLAAMRVSRADIVRFLRSSVEIPNWSTNS